MSLAAVPGARAGVPLFERPWVLLALALCGVAGFLILQPFGDVLGRLALPDTDDALRLVQVRDLIAGQGWFDNVQHRYLPPVGAAMHWSRLVDLPLATAILGLTPLLGGALAERIVVALWPPALFVAYLAIIWVGTRRLFGFRAACFAMVVGGELATTPLFAPGRIDHHNVQVLALTLAAMVLACRPGLRGGLLAGAMAAFSLAVGLETVPFVAVLGIVVVLGWVAEGAPARPVLAGFGGAFGAVSLVLFLVQTAPARWLVPQCDALSTPWLLLALGGGAVALALAGLSASRLTPWTRFAAAAALGAGLVMGFIGLFPQCMAGPYVGLPEAARTGWLDRVIEVLPMWRLAAKDPAGAAAIMVPLTAAFAAALVGLRAGPGGSWRGFVVLAGFSGVGWLLTFTQVRGVYVGAALVPVLGGWVFDRALARLGEQGASAWMRAGLLCGAMLFLTGFSLAAGLAVRDLAGLPEGLVSQRNVGDCSRPERLSALDVAAPGLVLAPVDLGPALLLHTRHAIIAAPYHRNGAGIVAGLAAASGSASDVEAAVRDYRPDYLLVCRDWAAGAGTPPDSLARTLVAGGAVPWLQSVPVEAGGLALWRVLPRASGMRPTFGPGAQP